MYDKLCVKILVSEKILLTLKLAQNLHGNKTGFVISGHMHMVDSKSSMGNSIIPLLQQLCTIQCLKLAILLYHVQVDSMLIIVDNVANF